MTPEEFRKYAHQAVDWVADYLENIEDQPVKSVVSPGQILSSIPTEISLTPESFEAIFQDLDDKIVPGITHWQHPNFHAYFPANTSPASIIGEIITAGIGAQCMVWETSPAAAELEERMMEWLRSMMNLPSNWHGVIQDTASTATLAALLTAREQATQHQTNKDGLGQRKLRVYCSSETHSSVEKAVKIAGMGSANLIKIKVGPLLAMEPEALREAIKQDLKAGHTPCAVVSALGTTGTLAFDPITDIGQICREFEIWHHIDAAYAGSALILPEYQYLTKSFDLADSFVFNPHKWLLTNFDCSAYFVKDKEALIRTFEILPEYLKTKTRGKVNDYRDWGVPLGRRFRALKLWFVFRSYGLSGLQEHLRNHIRLTELAETELLAKGMFELLTPRAMNVLVFRFSDDNRSLDELNELNEQILQTINASGEAFLSHTKVFGKYAIRLVIGQTNVEERHIQKLLQQLEAVAVDLQ